MSKSEEQERAREIREKQGRGETLTREEAGFLGAVASREATTRERMKATRAGRGGEFEEEHRVKSWMKGEETRPPHLSEEDERKEQRLREKQARGETLTREESGFLGGVARAREASEE